MCQCVWFDEVAAERQMLLYRQTACKLQNKVTNSLYDLDVLSVRTAAVKYYCTL